MYGRNLILKAILESSSSSFSFKRRNQALSARILTCSRHTEGPASSLAGGVVQRQSDGRILPHRQFEREVPPRQGPPEIAQNITRMAFKWHLTQETRVAENV
jgi:hypothetical protein